MRRVHSENPDGQYPWNQGQCLLHRQRVGDAQIVYVEDVTAIVRDHGLIILHAPNRQTANRGQTTRDRFALHVCRGNWTPDESVARQQDTAQSDVDVMIVSRTLGYGEVFGALEAATVSLGRKVNPTLYTPEDIAKRIQQDSAFVTRVLQQPTVWLIGTQEQLHVPTAG